MYIGVHAVALKFCKCLDAINSSYSYVAAYIYMIQIEGSCSKTYHAHKGIGKRMLPSILTYLLCDPLSQTTIFTLLPSKAYSIYHL